jgi:hypothetical protein
MLLVVLWSPTPPGLGPPRRRAVATGRNAPKSLQLDIDVARVRLAEPRQVCSLVSWLPCRACVLQPSASQSLTCRLTWPSSLCVPHESFARSSRLPKIAKLSQPQTSHRLCWTSMWSSSLCVLQKRLTRSPGLPKIGILSQPSALHRLLLTFDVSRLLVRCAEALHAASEGWILITAVVRTACAQHLCGPLACALCRSEARHLLNCPKACLRHAAVELAQPVAGLTSRSWEQRGRTAAALQRRGLRHSVRARELRSRAP